MNRAQAGGSRQEDRSRRTRERVLSSTVTLIREEGLPSASPNRITRHAGMSWGAVQHHFGSKEELLKSIVLRSRDQFHEAAMAPDYGGLDLAERVSLFADSAWQHYQSDVFLASVEITFWHRNQGRALGEDIASDNGRTSMLTRAMIEAVFAGTGADTDRLQEATEYMHCVFTGLAFQKILVGDASQLARHLAHCKEAMTKIIQESTG
jgi:AcrR family transcriptional regulator